jgi:hypothetical protein
MQISVHGQYDAGLARYDPAYISTSMQPRSEAPVPSIIQALHPWFLNSEQPPSIKGAQPHIIVLAPF